MWSSFPLFGSTLILAVMVVASYTFAVSLAAGASGRIKTLQAARFGAYGTVALIGVAVLCLAYAFVSHDFRLRYVAHYSDRGMPTIFLLTALWGGQDGSLLWWLFLLSIYVGVCVWQMGKKWLELQPYILATLMGIVIFFCVLMAFAADPFSTGVAGARNDGEGLNPLLQNFYMIIHPPSLYVGFVGCSIPFAFCIAALVTGRLDAEWIQASRKFTLFALLFLAIGNTLGMLWAYEELGWGGYWAWDPVENAAFMPLLVIAAFAHSVMIQERRGIMKVWNVFLICLTFFMTIFGTFLTRSGAIASVHSFAQSSIGEYFVWFLGIIFVFCASLIMYRWPELRGYSISTKLRTAALASGWTTIVAVAPGLYVLSGKLGMGPGARVAVFALTLGGAVFVAIEVVFRRLTQGLKLKATRPTMESYLSREFTFLLNNFGLLGIMFFILVATTFPMVSEVLWNEKVTVGPLYYNAWMQPAGLFVFLLMGVGTLFGWKKTSNEALKRAFVFPASAFFLAAAAHFVFGRQVGFPAVVWSEPIYDGWLGQSLRGFNAYTPVLGFSLCVFNAAVIFQEMFWLLRSLGKGGEHARSWLGRQSPGVRAAIAIFTFPFWLVLLPPTGRRRYGGYVVHLGICLMFLGFTGKSWTVDKETTISPGQKYKVESYVLEYVGPRMEVDNAKRMVFADVRVTEDGKERGKLNPAKFIYKKMPDSPTTEVAMMHSVRDDLYLVVGSINPETKVASLQIHINPLVGWIWFGAIILIFGSFVCMWPELEPQESRVWQVARGAGAVAASISVGLFLALLPLPAHAQQQASQHSGSIEIQDGKEKQVFQQLRCMCGTCPRELLSSCACSTADQTRDRIRMQLNRGMSAQKIIDDYVAEYGTASLAMPPNSGGMRAIYMVPIGGVVLAGIGLGFLFTRWRRQAGTQKASAGEDKKPRDAYDDRIDQELRDLDD
jgi:cytochrome c-type biogenesis protein CcmF